VSQSFGGQISLILYDILCKLLKSHCLRKITNKSKQVNISYPQTIEKGGNDPPLKLTALTKGGVGVSGQSISRKLSMATRPVELQIPAHVTGTLFLCHSGPATTGILSSELEHQAQVGIISVIWILFALLTISSIAPLCCLYLSEIPKVECRKIQARMNPPSEILFKVNIFLFCLAFNFRVGEEEIVLLAMLTFHMYLPKSLKRYFKKDTAEKSAFNCFFSPLVITSKYPFQATWAEHLTNTYAVMLTIPWKFIAVLDRKKNGEHSLERERCVGEDAKDDLLFSLFYIKQRLLKSSSTFVFARQFQQCTRNIPNPWYLIQVCTHIAHP